MVVVVERAQRLVPHHLESESLRDPLDGQVAKLLKFKSIHNNYELCKYFSVLE